MAGSSQSKVKKPHQVNAVGKFYLFLYNAGQVCGWSYLLYQILNHYASGKSTATLWPTVKYSTMVFQFAAFLEIVNVAIGLVKSNLVITTMQVFSRILVVGGAWMVAPPSTQSFGLPLALLAWSVTEVVRYSMYAFGILGYVPYPLTWIRYTFFYLLYPIGVTGELLCLYATQEFAGKTKLFSYDLPNSWNATFSYQYALLLIMASYLPGFPKMYYHMIVQRKKVLGQSGEAVKKTK